MSGYLHAAVKRVNGARITPAGGPYAVLSAEAYLVLTPEPVLVDCGGPPTYDEMRRNLDSLGVTPADLSAVVATHYHHDHAGNVVALRRDCPKISFAVHEEDAPDFVRQGGPDVELTRVDVPMADGQKLRFGEATFEVLHAPGHTSGSAAILVDIHGTRALFVGDAVHGLYFARAGRDAFDDLGVWARSLERLAACRFDYMFEGHVLPVHVLGDPSTLCPSERADFYNLLERRMASRRRGIAAEEARTIIWSQRGQAARRRLITPEPWIAELAAQRGGAMEGDS